MRWRIRWLGVAVVVLCLAPRTWGQPAPATAPAGLEVTHVQNAQALPPYDLFELTFQHERRYANPCFDVTKDGRYMSIHLGPEARQYVRAMQDFASRLDRDARLAAAGRQTFVAPPFSVDLALLIAPEAAPDPGPGAAPAAPAPGRAK
jgi:hypothetical protein